MKEGRSWTFQGGSNKPDEKIRAGSETGIKEKALHKRALRGEMSDKGSKMRHYHLKKKFRNLFKSNKGHLEGTGT